MEQVFGDYVEKTIEVDEIYQGKIFNVEKLMVELPNQVTAQRDIVRHKGAVAVLVEKDGKVLLVRQFRKAAERHLLEIPAGKLDHQAEVPLDAVKRELEEETGYAAQTWTKLNSFYPSPGYCDEVIHLYKAENLEKIDQPRPMDEDEFLDVVWADKSQVQEFIKSQEIMDLKTLYALAMYQLEQENS